MDNRQCEDYGILALQNVLVQRGVADQERQSLVKEFSGEIRYLFDVKTADEIEEEVKSIRG